MSSSLHLLAAVAVACSASGMFLLGYAGYRPVWNWLVASTAGEADKYRFWLGELFINRSSQQAASVAIAARMLVIGSAVLVLLTTGSIIFAAVTAFTIHALPPFIYQAARDKRMERIEEQLPDVVGDLVSSVRAGNALPSAIAAISQRFLGPIGQEFGLISREHLSGGLSIEDALARARDRLRIEHFTMVSSAIIINSEQGGDLLKILERMAEATRALSQLQKKIQVETAEVRAQEKIILFMTPLFGFLVCLFDSSIFNILFHTTVGNILLVMVVGLQIFCVAWIRRIVKTSI